VEEGGGGGEGEGGEGLGRGEGVRGARGMRGGNESRWVGKEGGGGG